MFKKYLLLISLFLILSTPIKAFEFKGKFEQGSFILGKTEPGSTVIIDNKKIRVSKNGFLPLD